MNMPKSLDGKYNLIDKSKLRGRGPDWWAVCGRTLRNKGTCKWCDKRDNTIKGFDFNMENARGI